MPDFRAERQRSHRILTAIRFTTLFACGVVGSFVSLAEEAPTPEQIEFFESRIRPVLAQDCYECHRTGGKVKGGLTVDHRAGLLKGGDSGPAIVPGDSAGSLLMVAIRHEDKDLEMPKAGAKLEDEIIADFEKWIAMGAPDPREKPSSEEEVAADTDWGAVMERRKSWWSFQPIGNPQVPAGDAAHPVDRFLDARLRESGLPPVGRADRRTLIRRLSFALRGLPPTPEESEAFVNNQDPQAYRKLVDSYLDSPQFGERWARHWMDWLRYADSSGSEGDPMIPQAWRYRDYLIRALNADVPYDQLVREHVAGDLLERGRIVDGRNESRYGPAHLRMVFHGFAPTDALDELVRFTDDQIAVLTKGFMGLTVSCARCHDHKFDAISQEDYYALFGILASTKPGMVTVDARGEEEAARRMRMEEIKKQIKESLAAHWLSSADALMEKLAAGDPALLEKAGDPKHVLHLLHAAADGDRLREAIAGWTSRSDELRAHREREYGFRWDVSGEPEVGTTHGPSAGVRQPPGSFTIATQGETVLQAIYPGGSYSHLLSSKDEGVALSPRTPLNGKYDIWARVAGDGDATIRYVVQNYPRNGTVYPVAGLKGGNWRWQRWGVDYWEGDHIHLEVTTAPDQAVLAKNNERSWIGLREVLLVEKGQPAPPGEMLEFVEPLLAQVGKTPPSDRRTTAAVYAHVVSWAVTNWRTNHLSDGEAHLLQEMLASGLLENNAAAVPGVAGLLDEYRSLEAGLPVPTRVPGVWEADPFDQPLFVRGNHKQPADPVVRRFLEAIDERPYQTEHSGRLRLAEDLLRPDNPFTRRVIVNRIWHHLFGRGLVATTDNFGRLGVKPSHPELLDYLAARFGEDGWSMKGLIRSLVLTDAWQRSSTPTERAEEIDPNNALLSHFRVQRLEAEAIRDSLLAVTGELQDAMYGPPITGGTPRRSVYMRIKRNDLDPFLASFDAPTPASTVGRRDVTNVPAQSLTMLNSEFVLGLAERWVDRVEGMDEGERARRMFTAALGRPPADDELESALAFVDAMAAKRQSSEGERLEIERLLHEAEVKLQELHAEARERVMAVRGREPKTDAVAGPAPIARWDFGKGTEDLVGEMDAKLQGGARIVDGALQVGGNGGMAATAPLRQPVRALTLEAWVQLDTLDQRGGGVISLQTLDGSDFNAVVYAERAARQWLAGSEFHKRSSDFGGPEEDAAKDRPVHVAIAWHEDGTIAAFRDGVAYGKSYQAGELKGFAAGTAQVLFGCRHGSPSGNRLLQGRIFEARLYDRALSDEEIAASSQRDPNFVTEAELMAAMSPAEQRERTQLLATRESLQSRLQSSDKPGRPGNEWADLAHALFNLKEFIYIR